MKIDFEKVLADYGLKVGDKVNMDDYSQYNPYIISYNEIRGFELVTPQETYLDIQALWDSQWEKVEPKKKVGELTCEEIKECSKCPLRGIECGYSSIRAIRSQWEETLENYPNLEPMREWVESELDKEVEE